MKKLLFVFAGLAFALTAAAQEFRITHGPYLCDMSQDGVTVVWTTNRPALSWVEASPADSLAPAPPPRHYQTVADRYVTVIPEIELPGHAVAALTSYPWLGC